MNKNSAVLIFDLSETELELSELKKICNYNPVNFVLVRRRHRCRHLSRCCRFIVAFWRLCRFQTGAAVPLTVQKFRPIWIVDDARAVSPVTETIFVASPNAFAVNFHFSLHQRINIRRISTRDCARTKPAFACFAFFLK